MQEMYGDALVALYRYGGTDQQEAAGAPKLLAVMREAGPDELKKYAAVHEKWLKKGIHPPLMMTRATMKNSTDVFPMEFLEMKETGELLAGEDVLAALDIPLENLRREVEEQVRGKLIHLRQGYMETGGDKKAIARLLAASIGPFTEVMRNVLRLMGRDVPVDREKAVREFCAETGLDEAPFIGALVVRRDGGKHTKEELDYLYTHYLEQVARLAEIIDKSVPRV